MERLQKVISESGYCSRRKAEELIINNKVMVNDVLVNKLGTKVNSEDIIKIDNKILRKEDKEYYLLNKPRGTVSTTKDDKNRKTIIELFKSSKRLYPVGRLDYDTTGAIIVTNDGDFANMIMHPKNKIEKRYIVKVKGQIKVDSIFKLKEGVTIDNIKCIPDKVKLRKYDKETNSSILEIIIHEGKNHEIKKLIENINYEVLKLKRESIAFLDLKNLKSGEYRKITPKELKKLYSLIKK